MVLCGDDSDCVLSPSRLGPQLYSSGAALKAWPGACPGSRCALLPIPTPGRFLRYSTDIAMAWEETTGRGRNDMAIQTIRNHSVTDYCPTPVVPLKAFYLWESELKGGDLHAQNWALTSLHWLLGLLPALMRVLQPAVLGYLSPGTYSKPHNVC